jgi:hypothetical protein
MVRRIPSIARKFRRPAVIRTSLAVVCAIVAPAFLVAQDKYTIKLKHAGQGDVTLHTKESTKKESITVSGPDGNVLQEKTQTTINVAKYKEETIEKAAGQKPSKVKRTYSEATRKGEDQAEKLVYHGQTVLIEKKGDGYTFSIDGKELSGMEAADLAQAFSSNKVDDDEMDKIMLPAKAVAVGESWQIDAKKLLKTFGEDDKVAQTMDLDKAKAGGKLIKAYRKDGRQYGIMEFNVSAPLRALEGIHPCREGAMMHITVNIDGCIDGSTEADAGTSTMKISGIADIVENGAKTGVTVKFDVSGTDKATTASAK